MATSRVILSALKGRNGIDPPIALPEDQAVEMLNVDRWQGLMARKRGGASAVTDTGGTAFSAGMQSLFRHIPGADETLAELWGIDGAATPIVKRMTGGTSFANVTLDDAISTKPQAVVGATLNGKHFLAYDSAVDRLHCYDPNLGSPRVRRVGIDPGASAPTAADTGAGAYAAVARKYRVRFLQRSGSTTYRLSEPTPASGTFTPSGAGSAARVTRPTAPGEGETHWIVESSYDGGSNWYAFSFTALLVAIGTTTYDDVDTQATWVSQNASDLAGTYGLFPSVKYLVTDGNRLLGAGAWESAGTTSGGKNSRVWFTPVLGSADKGDDERVPTITNGQKNWVDLNENDGGGITGLGVLNGVPYVFKYRQIQRLVPTGDVTVPYLPKKFMDGIGCVAHKSIRVGEDESGRPALYFLSHRGAYRLVSTGSGAVLQYLWRDNEDLTLNLAATSVIAHSVYFPDKHQWWLWVATGSNNDPDTLMVFDPLLGEMDAQGRIRKGWFKWTGNLAAARCSVLMSNTLGASMSSDLKPYLGRASGTAIWKGDTGTDDAGTTYQAYVLNRPIQAPLGFNLSVDRVLLLAAVSSGVTITLTLNRDYGQETQTSTVSLTASGSETRTLQKFEDSALAGAGTVQAQVGDGSAVSNSWVLDSLVVPIAVQEPR